MIATMTTTERINLLTQHSRQDTFYSSRRAVLVTQDLSFARKTAVSSKVVVVDTSSVRSSSIAWGCKRKLKIGLIFSAWAVFCSRGDDEEEKGNLTSVSRTTSYNQQRGWFLQGSVGNVGRGLFLWDV